MNRIKHTLSLLLFILIGITCNAQLDVTMLKKAKNWDQDHFMFFTNRTLEINEDGSSTFKNHTTKQTNSLHFCRYDFEKDSIEINYEVTNPSDKYPTRRTENNPIYKFYELQRLDRGIKNFYFIVGGYGKTFNKQVGSYMKRIKSTYSDSLFNKAAIIVFAWGDEDHAYRYYNGVRASKRGAADFSIFQHMLDEFISDTTYFETHPNDLTINIVFSSMGNYLFKEYLEERKRQNIPLIKTYHRITLLGSVTSRHSLEKGNEFYDLDQMTDSLDVYVNRKDALLFMSGIMHLSSRLGRKGPKDDELVPKFINIRRISDEITMDDLPGLGHDYLLTNDQIQHEILHQINDNINQKDKKDLDQNSK